MTHQPPPFDLSPENVPGYLLTQVAQIQATHSPTVKEESFQEVRLLITWIRDNWTPSMAR